EHAALRHPGADTPAHNQLPDQQQTRPAPRVSGDSSSRQCCDLLAEPLRLFAVRGRLFALTLYDIRGRACHEALIRELRLGRTQETGQSFQLAAQAFALPLD